MKKLLVLAAVSLVATSAFAGEMKWSGSTDWRYDQTKADDNLSTVTNGQGSSATTTRSHQIRANIGVTGGWENVEYGFDARTGANAGGAATTNTDYVTVQNGQDLGIGIDQAWFRYVHDFSSVDVSATVGRQKNVFAYDSSQNLFDNDVRFDGLGWNFKMGSFGLNAAQYVLGAKSQGTQGASSLTKSDLTENAAASASNFNYLIGFQPYMNWKFTDEIDAMFAVGYYNWINSATNSTGFTQVAGGTTLAPTSTVTSGYTYNVSSPKQWQFLTTWNLPANLAFSGELVINKKGVYGTTTVEGSKSAWDLGLQYGKTKKAHDWSLAYHYGSKGVGSVINAFTNDLFQADNKGHIVELRYNLADNFHIGWTGYFLKEKANLTSAGVARTGTAANQSEKSTYWDLTAGINF